MTILFYTLLYLFIGGVFADVALEKVGKSGSLATQLIFLTPIVVFWPVIMATRALYRFLRWL